MQESARWRLIVGLRIADRGHGASMALGGEVKVCCIPGEQQALALWVRQIVFLCAPRVLTVM